MIDPSIKKAVRLGGASGGFKAAKNMTKAQRIARAKKAAAASAKVRSARKAKREKGVQEGKEKMTNTISPLARLSPEQVLWARAQYGKLTQPEIARRLGVSQPTISNLLHRKTFARINGKVFTFTEAELAVASDWFAGNVSTEQVAMHFPDEPTPTHVLARLARIFQMALQTRRVVGCTVIGSDD
jgi:transcriptional regulator with XRE-family HTH domain